MRIAYFTGTYPRATDTFIQREVLALRQSGIDVFTFAVRSCDTDQLVSDYQKKEQRQTHYLLPASPLNLFWAHISLLCLHPKAYIKTLLLAWETHISGIKGSLFQLFYFLEAGLLAQQMRQKRIQHLHNHFGDSSCSVAMLASGLGGFGYSFTLHGPGIFFEPLKWRLDEKIRRASFVACISYFCRSQAMMFSPWEKWNNLHIIHCGVASEQFGVRQHYGKGRSLLYVGRLATAKGLPILLKSLVQLKQDQPDILLTVVGNGPDRALLESQVIHLGLTDHVQFVGAQSPASVQDYLSKTDVFVMSSFAEGVPVVLMEAMASGIPVVAPQVAGVSELVREGVTGYLVAPSDHHQLTQRINDLLLDGQLRQHMGKAGRQQVEENFDIQTEATKLRELLIQTIMNTSLDTTSDNSCSLYETTATPILSSTPIEG